MHTFLGGAATALIAAATGRVMHHADEVRAGRRRAFGWFLVWEVPTAVGMALMGDAVSEWLDLSRSMSVGVIAVLAYLGPGGAGAALERWTGHKKP